MRIQKRVIIMVVWLCYIVALPIAGFNLIQDTDSIKNSTFLWLPFFLYPFIFLVGLIALTTDKFWRNQS